MMNLEIAEQQGIKTTEDQPLKVEVPTLQVTDSQGMTIS